MVEVDELMVFSVFQPRFDEDMYFSCVLSKSYLGVITFLNDFKVVMWVYQV